MTAKRIIPCLDIKDGRAVKGVHFEDIRDAGDPVQLAAFYSEQGADELVFLDIAATVENRKTFFTLVEKLATSVCIPFTVGGGISELDDIVRLLDSGAHKISINTAAYNNPKLIEQAASRFGNEKIVVAIDVKKDADGEWYLHVSGGKKPTGKRALEWAREVADMGAGEILLTSMDRDGTKEGFAIDITSSIAASVSIPIIASGGAGKKEHFLKVFKDGGAEAALAASIFHFGEIKIPELKQYLISNHISLKQEPWK